MTTRTKKEQFIKNSDPRKVKRVVDGILQRHGLDFFEDCVIDEIVSELIAGERFQQKTNRANRKIAAEWRV
ncbi:hypothetical protein HB779_17475 [Phyllobacterium sp. 628]|uniref:hypothetical protein n=1 Tax=Phyllobacterium sp. 628 TaxID=2718938 RepID=UPI0016624676|nr:hypothetical protein [Phyllobacterium sp. 628]QND53478.1 hypothetical protein HB779_17475 [Phyllobacterium sp. 628]